MILPNSAVYFDVEEMSAKHNITPKLRLIPILECVLLLWMNTFYFPQKKMFFSLLSDLFKNFTKVLCTQNKLFTLFCFYFIRFTINMRSNSYFYPPRLWNYLFVLSIIYTYLHIIISYFQETRKCHVQFNFSLHKKYTTMYLLSKGQIM